MGINQDEIDKLEEEFFSDVLKELKVYKRKGVVKFDTHEGEVEIGDFKIDEVVEKEKTVVIEHVKPKRKRKGDDEFTLL